MSVAILKASWASLKMWDEEWMFFWMDSNTVCSLRASPGNTRKVIRISQTFFHRQIYFNGHNCYTML